MKKCTIQKWYQASLGYIIESSYNNDNYGIIKFENAEDYETSKVIKYLEYWKLERTWLNWIHQI